MFYKRSSFILFAGDEQKTEAREKGILSEADVQMEMALRSTAGMTDDDTAAMNAFSTGEEEKTMEQNEIQPLAYNPSDNANIAAMAAAAAAANAAAAAAGLACFEQMQKQFNENTHAAAETCSLQLPTSGPTTEGVEIEIQAAARRFTTYSSEDALAGMLFDTIVSPQTVLPNRAAEAGNHNLIPISECPEGASATKPKLTRAEALAAAMGGLNTAGADGIDLKELMTTGQQQAALMECSLPGAMQISPGLLASLSADLECPQEDGILPVTRALFV